MQCDLHFQFQSASFLFERAKVAYIISHLSDRAEAWATTEWARDSHVCRSLKRFTDTLSKVFDHTAPGREAAQALVSLQQGKRRVANYATLTAESWWNQPSLFDAFWTGLDDPVKDLLASPDLPLNLNSLELIIDFLGGKKERLNMPYICRARGGPCPVLSSPGGCFLGRPPPTHHRPLEPRWSPCSWVEPNCPRRSANAASGRDGESTAASEDTGWRRVQ